MILNEEGMGGESLLSASGDRGKLRGPRSCAPSPAACLRKTQGVSPHSTITLISALRVKLKVGQPHGIVVNGTPLYSTLQTATPRLDSPRRVDVSCLHRR